MPDVGISVFPKALIVESINLSDLLAFVISSQDGDSAWVSHLQGDQEGHGLDGVVSSINVISHEEIVVVGKLSSNFEEFFQIIELSMNITANRDWGSHWLNIALVHQDLLGFFTQGLDAVFWEGLAQKELVDLSIQILDVGEIHFNTTNSHIYYSNFIKL